MTLDTALRAVIPVAGLGTRMMPWTAAAPKALLPLVDPHRRIRPVIHWILADAKAAGVDAAALVISPDQQPLLRTYLDALDAEQRDEVPSRIEMIIQDRPAGFGEAVLRTQEFVGAAAVMVMLGDHVHMADLGCPPPAAQVARAWRDHRGTAMIGVQVVDADELPRVGTCRGEPTDEPGLYVCSVFVEKPPAEVARGELRTPGLANGTYLAHNGIYIFSAAIYDCLGELAAGANDGEVELAAAQALLLNRCRGDYRLFHPDGRACDVGTPGGYAATFEAFAAHGDR
ncbi:MAG: hypothetical protein GVY16_03845 [Planctomycetes bacterium]|jgi:UTP--glucose-1-phosphate uridylyltransferase|nr:hypothetical protein [Planctomycetota bacterium]